MQNETQNLILDLTFNFSVKIIEFTEKLNSDRHFILSNQLFKSGTSIGANVREAQNAESRSDFIHKMKIASKESDETLYWLMLADKMGYNTQELMEDCKRIRRILSKIISTSKSILAKKTINKSAN